MNTPTFYGFIYAHDNISCSVICDYDNKTYILPIINEVLPVGLTVLSDTLTCDIFALPITGKKLISAFKAYKYDTNRTVTKNQKYYQKKKASEAIKITTI